MGPPIKRHPTLLYHNMGMWLFRKSLDLKRAAARRVTAEDLTRVSRLLRDGGRRYYGLSQGDLPPIVGAGYGIALVSGEEIWGVALTSWAVEGTCWLRAFALAEGADLEPAAGMLLPALHATLAEIGIDTVYYSGDETADGWMTPLLAQHGYETHTDVIVYEKRDWEVPSGGNPHVQVRPAVSVDLAEVLLLDRACFEPQWTKDDTILGPAIAQGPLFLVAERAGELAGYAYATSHFHGRLIHLVRIAVAPQHQNAQIGVRLLAEVVAYAAEHSADLITLNTQAYNLHAQRLYRWFGFTPSGEHQSVLRRQLTRR